MNKMNFIIGVGLILLLATCDIRNVVLLAIKNETHCVITGAYLLDDSVSDDEIYNDHVHMGINLKQDSLQWISMPNFKFEDKSDTSKLDIFRPSRVSEGTLRCRVANIFLNFINYPSRRVPLETLRGRKSINPNKV
ncbi:MAG: hypothetical protein ACXVAY_17180 [Mucilaginibacter sp.]